MIAYLKKLWNKQFNKQLGVLYTSHDHTGYIQMYLEGDNRLHEVYVVYRGEGVLTAVTQDEDVDFVEVGSAVMQSIHDGKIEGRLFPQITTVGVLPVSWLDS